MNIISMIIGGLLGAAAMYMLDPRMGNRRRALLRDQLVKARNEATEAAQDTAEQLQDRAQGAAATARRTFDQQPVSDATLVARIRSELGRVSTHPGAIEVTAANAMVVLSGHVLASEVERIMSAVRSVPGVKSAENRLMVHQTAESIPALQGGGQQGSSTMGGPLG